MQRLSICRLPSPRQASAQARQVCAHSKLALMHVANRAAFIGAGFGFVSIIRWQASLGYLLHFGILGAKNVLQVMHHEAIKRQRVHSGLRLAA